MILPTHVPSLLDFPVIASGHLFIPRGLTAGLSMVLNGAVLANPLIRVYRRASACC